MITVKCHVVTCSMGEASAAKHLINSTLASSELKPRESAGGILTTLKASWRGIPREIPGIIWEEATSQDRD